MRMLVLALAAACRRRFGKRRRLDRSRQAPTGRYAMETRHSQVLFAIAHQGITDYYGRFDKLSGTLAFDSAEPGQERGVGQHRHDEHRHAEPGARTPTLTGKAVFDAAGIPDRDFQIHLHHAHRPQHGKDHRRSDDQERDQAGHARRRRSSAAGHEPDGRLLRHRLQRHGHHQTHGFRAHGHAWEPFVGDDVKLIIEALFQQQKD